MKDRQLIQNDSENLDATPITDKIELSDINSDINAEKSEDKRSFIEKWEQSPYWLVSASYKVLHSIWMVFMAVGMFLAWLIALLAT